MQFIRLISSKPDHAYFNMALDEAISEAVRQKLSPPTLRLYQWETPSLSIGHFQKISDIDIDYCNNNKYPVVRRLTGGRAILHDSELTYSFSSLTGSSLFDDSLINNYTVLSNALVSGLKLNGIDAINSFRKKKSAASKNPACFKAVSYGEITVKNKKIIGSAQKRFKNSFLQHRSILMSFNWNELCKVLKYNNGEKFSDIGSVSEYAPEVSIAGLRRSLRESFETTLEIKIISDNPSKFELGLAKELEATKYSNDEWNFRR